VARDARALSAAQRVDAARVWYLRPVVNTFLPPRSAVFFSLASLGLLAGCASLLGDFSVGEGTDGGIDGGTDGTSPVPDGGFDASDTGTTPKGDSGADGAADTGGGPQDANTGDDGAPDSGPIDSGLDGADQSAPWTPAVLDQAGSLALWLEASGPNVVISGGLVETWNDQSKNKNDASNPNGGPTVAPMAINGHDALTFDSVGVTLGIPDAQSLQFGTDQVYITAVAKVNMGTPYFFGKFTAGQSGAGSFYSTGLVFLAQSGTDDAGATILGPVVKVNSLAGDEVDWGGPAFEDGKAHVVAMRRTSASGMRVTVDSKPPVEAQTGSFDVSEPGQPTLIGAVLFGNFHPSTNFEIAEIVAVHSSTGVVADADVANLHGYLMHKYGL